MRLSLLTKEEREAIEQRATQAFKRGLAECENSFTWADPGRPASGALTSLDEAYDLGRSWGYRHMLEDES